MSLNTFSLFASCPKGIETLLLEELRQLGVNEPRETVGGVFFKGELKDVYHISLWTRLANRILLPVIECSADSIDTIYQAITDFPWEKHIDGNGSILVHFSGSNHLIKNTQFGAQKVKDGIVDRLRVKTGNRPSIEKTDPDIRIQAYLGRGQLRINIDLTGSSLQNRLYNDGHEKNTLHSNLAAALLTRCQWPELAQSNAPFYDLQCDGGTLLIEAAMMAANFAPGLLHKPFSFEKWLMHDQTLWETSLEDAKEKREQGLTNKTAIIGFDSKISNIHHAEKKIKKAGLSYIIKLHHAPIVEVENLHKDQPAGLILTSVPYDDEAENSTTSTQLYRDFGEKLKQEFSGWQAGLFTANPAQARHLNIRARKKYKFQSELQAAQLMIFDIKQDNFYERDSDAESKPKAPAELSEGAKMFANRVKKNQKQLAKWLNKNQITCYRLYDADMPEYAVAIDIYEDHSTGQYAHVQEYAAPKKVDPAKAQQRFAEIQSALPQALDIPETNITYKERRQQKGKSQYERATKPKQHGFIEVQEGAAKLLVNLHDYLDVGLFLDHRPVRMEIAAMARNQRFLNLFCYTASPTVHAALAGARSSVSVDMSNTYIDWAEKNFILNDISTEQHQLVQADCFQWLKSAKEEKFDLIMLDPPSFSNSKRMDSVLDIQRDHVGLIKMTMRQLDQGGTLIFSNNLRSFKLDTEALGEFDITNISAQTLDKDFQRNQKIHQCWLISHNPN